MRDLNINFKFSFFFILLLNYNNLFGQSTIQGDIILFDNSECVCFIMPFYGKISGMSNGIATFAHSLRKVDIEAGSEFLSLGHQTCNDIGNWGGRPWGPINHLPLGTEVYITVWTSPCIGYNQFTEADYELEYLGNNSWQVNYNCTHVPPHTLWAINIGMEPEDPPVSDCDEYQCSQNFEKAIFQFNKVPDGTICEAKKEPAIFAIMQQAFEIPYFTEVCYNIQKQRWDFTLNNENTIPINYAIELCPDYFPANINVIDDHNQFPAWVTCDEITEAFKAHHTYPNDFTYARYYLKNLKIIHEEGHLADYMAISEFNKKDIFDPIYSNNTSCEDLHSPNEASNWFSSKISSLSLELRETIWDDWNNLRGNGDEDYLLDYEKLVQKGIQTQLEELERIAKSNNNCPLGG